MGWICSFWEGEGEVSVERFDDGKEEVEGGAEAERFAGLSIDRY